MWSLQRIQIGYGKFSRAKLVAIICNGEDTPVMTRAKLKARTPEVLKLFGSIHAQIEVQHVEDCSVDKILEKVLSLFHDDRIEVTLRDLKHEYDKSLRLALVQRRHQRIKLRLKSLLAFQIPRRILDPEEQAESSNPAITEEPEPKERPEPKEVENLSSPHDKANVTLDDAMKALAVHNGRFNWVIMEPTKLALHNAGTGG